jgi:hypothetical protein
MPAERTTMRHVREVLRLKFGANDPREVARRRITTAALDQVARNAWPTFRFSSLSTLQ